jgi:ABC-2 type transport system ATP-binding protein
MVAMTQTALTFEQVGTSEPVMSVQRLCKAYGDRQVLDGLTFHVDRGEIFGILGPNGAGKTSAVEIAQGLRTADSGAVRVLGLDPAAQGQRLRRVVGSQLQSSALPDRLRVGEALRLFSRIAGDVVDWRTLMDDWDLARLQREAFRSLSGGERQRLFIALALVNRPQVVFLDELTQGLDPAARRETWRLIERIRDDGATVVLVSHYMDEVEQLCDRVGVLRDGRMDVTGTPAQLVAVHGGMTRCRFTAERSADVAATIEALPGVAGVRRRGAVYDVSCDPESIVWVAGALDRNGLTPADFTVVRPSLEDVFVALTETGGER